MAATNVLEVVGISVINKEITVHVCDDDGNPHMLPLEGRGLDLISDTLNKRRLQFNTNEQNAMAMICEMMSSIAYKFKTENELPDEDKVGETLLGILDGCGRNLNWGDMYDRFHRQGVNR